jgi:16S rRNA (cytosine967-C5)-methyltransferase
LIQRVAEEGAYSNLALAAALRHSPIDDRDRSLVTQLVTGTLRRMIPIDWVLDQLLARPLERAHPRTRAALRLGAFQILYTRIPDHAAIAETVGLAPPSQRGLVNAVLRRVAAEPPAWPAGPRDEAVSVRTGLVAWAVGELRRLLGSEAEEAAAALAPASTPLALRMNPCLKPVQEIERALADAGYAFRRGTLYPDSLVLDGGGSLRSIPGGSEGWFTVQDEASSFVVGALDPQPGERVLDACAAPGGKATHAACLGATVVAADVHPRRIRLVAREAVRLGLPIRVLAQDARRPAIRAGFDRVLVDAPCSGLGSARRRPELLWRPRREALSRLARLQVAIASSAAGLLRPGARLVYSVCTFPRAETDAACDALLHRRPDLEPEALEGPNGPEERIRLWPHRHGADAMFVAAFRRRT